MLPSKSEISSLPLAKNLIIPKRKGKREMQHKLNKHSWEGTKNIKVNPEEREENNLTKDAFKQAHALLSAKFTGQLSS